MRAYLDKLLMRSHIEQAKLSRFERILFTSYGTLTAILEAYLYEPIQIVNFTEKFVSRKKISLNLKNRREVIPRKVLLEGQLSGNNFVYAESIFLFYKLYPKFREELLKSQIPRGKLRLEYKIEIFTEIINSS